MSWLSYLTGTGKSGGRDSTREAIVSLREHLLMLEKKEDHLNSKIAAELVKAKANATTNKRGGLYRPRELGLFPRLQRRDPLHALQAEYTNLLALHGSRHGGSATEKGVRE